MGALHPVLFFLFIYGISLILAIFVCRTVYYSMNDTADNSKTELKADLGYANTAASITALK
jgi:hypothetical protein